MLRHLSQVRLVTHTFTRLGKYVWPLTNIVLPSRQTQPGPAQSSRSRQPTHLQRLAGISTLEGDWKAAGVTERKSVLYNFRSLTNTSNKKKTHLHHGISSDSRLRSRNPHFDTPYFEHLIFSTPPLCLSRTPLTTLIFPAARPVRSTPAVPVATTEQMLCVV